MGIPAWEQKCLGGVPLRCRRFSILVLAVTILAAAVAGAQEPTGAVIYQQKCARCHGKAGEGTKDHPQPLIGNRSLPQLAKYIAKSMPEDKPGTCTGADAEKVAAYIFDAFYSPAAQARTKAPRVELAHLTVSEYRNAVADLIGSFRKLAPGDSPGAKYEHGLRGEYFNAGGKKGRTLAFARLDPVVRIDFGASSPDMDKLKGEQISATWQGSVVAIDTGMYDFIVRT
jgi:mono/diheme cytochrome c family protein